MTATTIEQSRGLLELGIDPNTADMTWVEGDLFIGLDPAIEHNLFAFRKGILVPAWSLDALLDLLPFTWNFSRNSKTNNYNIVWMGDAGLAGSFMATDKITTVYKLVSWLLEHGYIGKK